MATGGITLPRVRWAAQALAMDRRVFVCAAALGCIVLALLVYWPRLTDYFVYDDFFFLRAVRNHSFRVVMYRAITFPKPKPFDEVTLFWRPLIDLYFYGGRVFGLHPEPYHLVNILVHGIVGALAVLFIWRVTGSVASGAVTGMLFTIAPTYDVAVTWISEVSELIGAALILSALISYHAYLTAVKPSPLYYRGAVALTVLALLTKESTIILLVLLPSLALALGTTGCRRSSNEIVRSIVPLAFLVLSFSVVMLVHDYREGGEIYGGRIGPHMVTNVWDYLKWIVLPYPDYDSLASLRTAGASLFLAAPVLALALRQRVLAFLALWTVTALIPFSGFSFIGPRYTYLATLPYVAFVVSSVIAIGKTLPEPLKLISTGVFGVAVAVALVTTSFHTRDQQIPLAREAAGYETMIESVQKLCGEMPPESSVYVVDAPYRDLHGIHTPAAVNLYYDHVYAAAVEGLHPSTVFIENTCVLQYDAATETYARID